MCVSVSGGCPNLGAFLGASWRRLPLGRQGGGGGQEATEAADSALVCSLNSWYSCRVLYNSLDSWYSCRVLYNASKAGGCLTDPESVARGLPLWFPIVVSPCGFPLGGFPDPDSVARGLPLWSPLMVSPCGLPLSSSLVVSLGG